jgi:hypothetical protein
VEDDGLEHLGKSPRNGDDVSATAQNAAHLDKETANLLSLWESMSREQRETLLVAAKRIINALDCPSSQ